MIVLIIFKNFIFLEMINYIFIKFEETHIIFNHFRIIITQLRRLRKFLKSQKYLK